MTSLQKWLRTIAWLRRKFPAQRKVYVRSMEIKEYDGYAVYMKNCFFISVNQKKPLATKLDTLLHEWAHTLTWFGADQKEHHSDEWGLWYAKIYRAFHEWNFREN